MKSTSVTVIGHLCLDVIRHPDGAETRSYGGIYFSLLTLASVLTDADRIYPVFGVGKAEYDDLIERLSVYPNIDPSGIYKFSGPTNQVTLMYTSTEERLECSKHIAEPIPWKRIKPYTDVDVILVNMISGFDIALETLDELRMEVRDRHIPVYLDVHSLTLGVNAECVRIRRPVEGWRRWLFWLHAVQMNEEEAAMLTAERLEETALAKHVLALNTKVLTITRGANGCTAFIDNHKVTQRIDEPGITPESAIDPTGCGDVFAAAYCAHYGKSGDITSAFRFANRVAAAKAQLAGSVDLDTLASFRIQEPAPTERAS